MRASSSEVTKEQQEIFDYEPYGMVLPHRLGAVKPRRLPTEQKASLSDTFLAETAEGCLSPPSLIRRRTTLANGLRSTLRCKR